MIIMPFKFMLRELKGLKDGSKIRSREQGELKSLYGVGRSHIAPEMCPSPSAEMIQEGRWASLPPELLLDIIQRIEVNQIGWPSRRDVIAFAAVCSSWRERTIDAVRTPKQCGLLTFPISLKQHCQQMPVNYCWLQKKSKEQ